MHILATIFLPLLAAPLVTAHGKIVQATGDQGGNTTALGILGDIVPRTGKNGVTEIDTTVFPAREIATDGLGKTKESGEISAEALAKAMELSGDTLPQVSSCGGSINATYRIVTTDGAGPVDAIIDPSAAGQFSVGVKAYVITNLPGKFGRMYPNGTVPRSLDSLAMHTRSLVKRAANVNLEFPVDVVVPAGMRCSGKVAGKENVCFMKIANSHKNGPFGGVLAFQVVPEAPAAKRFRA